MATPIRIRYKGLICFGETDEWSGSDEIYIVTSVASADGRVVTTRQPNGGMYNNVDKGASFAAPISDIWAGIAQDLVVTTTVFEHDEGDPDHWTRTIGGAVTAATAALIAAGAAVVSWVPPVAGAIVNALLGAGDDDLGTQVVPLTETQVATHVFLPGADERGIRHDFFNYHSGQGSTYKVYFDVVV